MSDFHDADSGDESEFGLGPGMIEASERANRSMPLHQELWEIYAIPKTFDGATNGIPVGDPETTPVPRLLPDETEADRK